MSSNGNSGMSGGAKLAIVVAILIVAFFLLGPILSLAWGLAKIIGFIVVIGVAAHFGLRALGRNGLRAGVQQNGLTPGALSHAVSKRV